MFKNQHFFFILASFVIAISVASGALVGGGGYKALSFGGKSWVEIPSSASSLAGNSFSIEAWILVNSTTSDSLRPIVTRYNSNISSPHDRLNDFALVVNPQGYVVFFAGGSQELGFLTYSSNTLIPNVWYHVAFSIEYINGHPYRAELYVDYWNNGTIVRDDSEALWLGPGYTRATLLNEAIAIGHYNNFFGSSLFIGAIDEVSVWSGVRLRADIDQYVFRTVGDAGRDVWTITVEKNGTSPNLLIASYNFNSGSSSVVSDASNNQFNARIHCICPTNTTYVAYYIASPIPIVSYYYSVGNVPLQIFFNGIDSKNFTNTNFVFNISYTAELRGTLYQYDPTNSGTPVSPVTRPTGIQTPGIGSVIVSGQTVVESVVFVYKPTDGQSVGRFFYTVQSASGHSETIEIRIVLGCKTGVVDACGQCNKANKAQDGCGVCFGDNSTCAGCDGIPYSGKIKDSCGRCGGSNSCLGCDGKPWSGLHYDRCGVCNGTNSTCSYGCDGSLWSNKTYDKCGVCGGNNSCAGCDGRPYSGLEFDACNVCGGNNGTCMGCDGCGGGVYDECGVCNGDGKSCKIGCDGKNGSLAYDSCGVCGGDNSTCHCVTYHGYHVQELDYILLQWGLTKSLEDLCDLIKQLDGSLDRLDNYKGDLDLASVVLYFNDFLKHSLHDYEHTIDTFTKELDISLGNRAADM